MSVRFDLSPSQRRMFGGIVDAVSRHSDVHKDEIVFGGRATRIVRARWAAMWLCGQLTDASLPQIGAYFGGRDHTTVLHAHRCVSAQGFSAFLQPKSRVVHFSTAPTTTT